jgi:hypothetical protein
MNKIVIIIKFAIKYMCMIYNFITLITYVQNEYYHRNNTQKPMDFFLRILQLHASNLYSKSKLSDLPLPSSKDRNYH